MSEEEQAEAPPPAEAEAEAEAPAAEAEGGAAAEGGEEAAAADGDDRQTIKPSSRAPGMPSSATDAAVAEYMQTLVEHKKKCEAEGKYFEAQSTSKRIMELRLEEDRKLQREIADRQGQEVTDAQSAFKLEMEQHTAMWEKKMAEFEKSVLEQVNVLRDSHEEQVKTLRDKLVTKQPQHARYSKDLLDTRNRQDRLARQGMYAEAARLKRDANKMEEAQLQGTLAEFDAQVSLKEQQLLLKQKREIEALMQRAQRGRDELQLTRKQDVERRSQRFKNVMQELANLHTLESVQLRHYLEQQVVAGKRLDVA
ncbi:hypothetical protein NFJ02_04g113660 [Pycnococcus provasolii]